MIKRSKRRRVSREQVRKNAKEGGKSRLKILTLPSGVSEWWPDKPGRMLIDILPYEVSDKNHPDNVKKGQVWYKRSFFTHRVEGGNIVCPKSMGDENPCDWCKMFFKLKKEDASEDVIKNFSRKPWTIYNIKDPNDKNKIAIFSMSSGKFANPLSEVLGEPANNKHALFFDCDKNGRTIKVRFGEKKFNGNKFIQALEGSFVFKPRKPMDEEKIFKKVVDLDKCLKVLEPEQLKKIFKSVDVDGDDEKSTRRRKDKDRKETRLKNKKKFKAKASRLKKHKKHGDEEE